MLGYFEKVFEISFSLSKIIMPSFKQTPRLHFKRLNYIMYGQVIHTIDYGKNGYHQK